VAVEDDGASTRAGFVNEGLSFPARVGRSATTTPAIADRDAGSPRISRQILISIVL
jgi:hypothetical protein